MRMKFVATLLLVLCLCATVLAQSAPQAKGADQDTGVRPYVPFGGANENINLTNGNLSLSIPLVHLKGRNGNDLSLNLYYNSKSWRFNGGYSADTNSMGGTWIQGTPTSDEPAWLHFGDGWRLGIPTISGSTNIDWVNSRCEGEAFVTMSDGSRYAFNNRYGCGLLGAPGTQIAVMDSEDGTGLQLDMSTSDDYVLTMRDGTRVHFPGPYGVATKIVDANGNKTTFSVSGSVFTITDTLGRTASVDTSTPSVTYKDSSGTSRSVTFSSGDVSVDISFYNPYPSTVSNPRIIAGNRTNSYTTTNLTGVTIPVDGSHSQTFTFAYDSYNELSKITYPTGGYTSYSYAVYMQHQLTTDPSISGDLYADFREISQRAVCKNSSGSCTSEDITTYTATLSGTANNQYMDVVDPFGNKTRHQFTQGVVPGDGTADDHGESPREINVWFYSGTSTLLKTVHTDYDNYSGSTPVTYEWSVPTKITTTLNDVSPNLIKEEDLSYPTFSVKFLPYPTAVDVAPSATTISRLIDNVTTHLEYDWGSGSTGSLLRRTVNEWVTTNSANSVDYFSSAVRLLSLKSKTSVFPLATGTTPLASTRYTYDGYGSPYDLVTTSASNHEAPPTPSARGNLTKVERWRASDDSWLATDNQFDDTGNIVKTRDPGLHRTYFAYGESGSWNETTCYSTADSFAYVTTVTNELGHTNTSKFNSCTGTLASAADANSQVTSQTFDGIGRPLVTSLADGGRVEHIYDDSSNKVTTKTRHAGTTDIISLSLYDGLGRPILEELCEDATTSCTAPIKTDTTYDAMGRKSTVSNPYRTTSDVTYGLTEYRYDALGRVVRVLPPDAPRDSSDINNIKTDYAGNKTTVTDQAGKQRVSYVDALGRLVRVEEPGVSE